MTIFAKPVAHIYRSATSAQLAEAQATLDRCELAEARVAALRDALAAAIRRERTVGGYCSHEDQQARRDAEALIVETGGKP